LRRLAAALLLLGCPALYSPHYPDLGADDLAVADLTRADPCAGCDGTCLFGCMPAANACDGVQCPVGESCLDGVCFAGCVVDRCAGVTCGAQERCWQGRCVGFAACDFTCPGTICGVLCLPGAQAARGSCSSDGDGDGDGGTCQCGCLESCVGGECVPACEAPDLPCACECCPPTLSCGSDGHCHGMIS
jgi:hypothetical protein